MIKEYPLFEEQVITKTLKNGLQVIVIPKPDYKRSFVFFATQYGAFYNRFRFSNLEEDYQAPLGIAHFLEHQLFTLGDGKDASEIFAMLGLESNALTNYAMTGYLFQGTKNILKGLTLLLDFVQKPHFTKASVAKEQGIIAQELKMYLDRPTDVLHLGLMKNMFYEYPLQYDIGGTLNSIKAITAKALRTCHKLFYHPSNMYLVIVGDINQMLEQEHASVDDLFAFVEENQKKKTFAKKSDVRITKIDEPKEVKAQSNKVTMDVTVPRVSVGIKLPQETFTHNEVMMLELSLKIILEATFGPSTDNFQTMLDEKLIQSGIGIDVHHDGVCGYVKVTANTENPEAFTEYVSQKFLALNTFLLDEETLERYKKAMVGNFIKALNSFEFMSIGYVEYLFKNCDLLEAPNIQEQLSLHYLRNVQKYFVKECLTSFMIVPKTK